MIGEQVEDRAAALRTDRPSSVPWAAVGVFIVISYALAWLVALPLWFMDRQGTGFAILLTLLATAMMFTPTVAVLVVVFLLKLPRSQRMRFLGMWPLRPAKRVVWFTVAAILAPAVIVALTAFISSAFGLVRLDLVTFSGFQQMLSDQLGEQGAALADAMPPVGMLVVLQLAMIPFGALINSVFAFGEEVGWRGWLLPALRPLGLWPALVISGAIWGLWHSPLILLGYNFGYTDWRGVALMTGGCVAWGVLLGWARLRSGSVWPAVVGHGALNASAGLVVLFAAAGEEPVMGIVGPLGVVAWAVIAVIVVVLVLLGQFSREPELAPDRARHMPPPVQGVVPAPNRDH